MLNDYGIQHFHLGTVSDPKHPNLIKGTKELLFAVVKDNDFYALGIFDHKAWSKQALLEIIKANWPQLIKPYELAGNTLKPIGLSRNYTDDEVATLRKHGINTLTQGADGSIRAGLGGGLTTDGGSLSVTRELIKIEKYLTRLEQDVLDEMSRNGTPQNAEVRIEWRGDTPFAVTIPAGAEINLSDRLSFPPL
jgi:hypothetical protein